MAQLRQRFAIAVKEENGKHFACIADSKTGIPDYETPPCDSLEDALSDIYAELTLRYAAKGEIIQIKTKKQMEEDEA